MRNSSSSRLSHSAICWHLSWNLWLAGLLVIWIFAEILWVLCWPCWGPPLLLSCPFRTACEAFFRWQLHTNRLMHTRMHYVKILKIIKKRYWQNRHPRDKVNYSLCDTHTDYQNHNYLYVWLCIFHIILLFHYDIFCTVSFSQLVLRWE